ATFRDLERREVERALAGHDGVLSLGGGSVLDETTQGLLAGHTVVYLQVGIADAAKRVGFDRSRPLLALQPRAAWVRLMEERRGARSRVASSGPACHRRGRPGRPCGTRVLGVRR